MKKIIEAEVVGTLGQTIKEALEEEAKYLKRIGKLMLSKRKIEIQVIEEASEKEEDQIEKEGLQDMEEGQECLR